MKVYTKIIAVILFNVILLPVQSTPLHFSKSTTKFEFKIDYWINMHHFLYRESYMQLKTNTSLLSNTLLLKLEPNEIETLSSTISFYKEEIHNKHFFYSDYMGAVASYLRNNGGNKLPEPESEDLLALIEQLNNFDEIYRKHLWDDHYLLNRKILDENLEAVIALELDVSHKLARLFSQEWQEEKIRVDVCVYGGLNPSSERNIPYSSLEPITIVMTSSGALNQNRGHWVELLFHEASHHLVFYNDGHVTNTINSVSKDLGVQPPRGLWHAYLFYIVGKVVKEKMVNSAYEVERMYMYHYNVFSNLHRSLYILDSFVNGESDLSEATSDLLIQLAN